MDGSGAGHRSPGCRLTPLPGGQVTRSRGTLRTPGDPRGRARRWHPRRRRCRRRPAPAQRRCPTRRLSPHVALRVGTDWPAQGHGISRARQLACSAALQFTMTCASAAAWRSSACCSSPKPPARNVAHLEHRFRQGSSAVEVGNIDGQRLRWSEARLVAVSAMPSSTQASAR